MKRLLLGFTAWLATIAVFANGIPAELTQAPAHADLPDFGPAPEFTNESWLNSDVPLRLSQLRGQVVLLDMWTFGCINCINITPYVQDWHTRYAEQGLVVIGNHFPEFSYERDIANIRDALPKLGITYPIAQDNPGDMWRAWSNRYWPTIYLIDKQGHVRYTHIGEGGYEMTEAAVQVLLAEPYSEPNTPPTTPETPLSFISPAANSPVQAAASDTAPILGTIYPGEAYIIRGQENGWYRIAYNDGEGYVKVTLASTTREATLTSDHS